MNAATPIVYVVDDDPSICKSLSRLLTSEGFRVETFVSATGFIEQHDPMAAGCVLLDLEMPVLNGIELQQVLAERCSAVPIVFLTGHGDIPSSVAAMKGGAVDFLTKPADKTQLLAAVNRAIERNALLRREREERTAVERLLASLTPREREVLGYLACGRRNKQIAADLGTVEKTIKVHRARVLQKMEAKTLPELIQRVVHAGIDLAGERVLGAADAFEPHRVGPDSTTSA